MPLLITPSKRILLFIHIPKTGGTSIKSNLRRGVKVAFDDEFKKELPCPPQHFQHEIMKRMGIENLVESSFAIVRHPVKRFVSEYTYRKIKDRKFRYIDIHTFALFCKKLYPLNHYLLANHLRPQHEFIDVHTRVFKIEEGLSRVYEEYYEFFVEDIFFSKENVSGSEGLRLDIETYNLICDFYKKDFDIFSYDEKEFFSDFGKLSFIKKIKAEVLSTIFKWVYTLKIKLSA